MKTGGTKRRVPLLKEKLENKCNVRKERNFRPLPL